MAEKDNNSSETDPRKELLQATINFGRKSKKEIISTITGYIILIVAAVAVIIGLIAIGIPSFNWLFQQASPWSQQRKDIADKNNVRDAYSAIIGSDVGMVSQNGIVKWFSSKEAKEIDISIPKLINYSPLFDDDSRREELKAAFKDSINPDVMLQSTTYYKIFYDGSTIGTWKDGEEESTYKNLKESDKKLILKDLRLKLRTRENIEFKEWQKKNKLETVDYDFVTSTNTVNITGVFESDGKLWTTPEYNLAVRYEYADSEWHLVKDTLKVEKIK